MRIEKLNLLGGAASARGVCVIIDAFRAFSTACFAMNASPHEYLLVGDSSTATRLAATTVRPFLIGKPERGAHVLYDAPNSPTRVLENLQRLSRATLIHRTQAGARGMLQAMGADELIAGSFVNADAIARYIRTRKPPQVTLVAMGHEGETTTLEDDLCANYIAARIEGTGFDILKDLETLRHGPGKYFFTEAQDEYPREDFAYCTGIDRFSFVLRGERQRDYVRLVRVDV